MPEDWAISASTYRFSGIPDGIDLMTYGPDAHPEVVDGFRTGPIWEQLGQTQPDLVSAAQAAACCVVLRGTIADPDTLDYHRNLVGLIQWLFDQGCASVLDLNAITWWAPDTWRSKASTLQPRPRTPMWLS